MPSKSRPGLAVAVAAVVTAASGLAVLLAPTVAMAAGCTPQPNGQTVCSFDSPGKYTMSVPPGSTNADATLVGGSGGPGAGGAPGGHGQTIHGTLNLPSTSGLQLDIYVGAGGASGVDGCEAGGGHSDGLTGDTGVHGGDGGESEDECGGGGGGGTFIMIHGIEPTSTEQGDKPLAAAGGGGGAGTGGANKGGDGGTPEGAAGAGPGGGAPGTQQGGGDGGDQNSTSGEDGSRGNGGRGANDGNCNCGNSGGGGGGGFFGGGGGAAGFGGGGGSGCMNCVAPESQYETTSIPAAPGANSPGPVFRMAQAGSHGSVMLIFGNIVAAPTPPGPGTAPPVDHHHSGNNNDPNPNTNPTQRSNDRVTTTTVCEPRIGICRIGPIVGPDSVFNVTATGGAKKAVLYGTLQGGSRPDCPDYAERNSDWLDFGFTDRVAGSTWHKATSLTTRHKMSRPAALELSRSMQICFEAPYRFPTRPGYDLGSHHNLFDGVLPDCAAAAAGRGVQRPCVQARQLLQRKGGWVVRLLFRVPANSKDPKALG
jgi:hypothetical protein